MTDQLVFNDSIELAGILGTGLTTLGGTVNIDYGATNTVTGSLSLTAVGALAAQTYTNLVVTQTGVGVGGTPVYTLTGSTLLTSVSITYTGQLPSISATTVDLLSTGLSVAAGIGNVTSTALPCFAAGTMIRTPDGDVAIENLRVGDLVITTKGEQRPVKWLSSRTVLCKNYHDPRAVLPVSIIADAFGPGAPDRDLLVSPGHAICVSVVEEVLIPASLLVNGSTITQVDVDEVTYCHVELDSHDIIFANGLPAESFIDVGNRLFFTTGQGDVDPQRNALSLTDYCRPFVTEDIAVRAVRARLRSRALSLGWTLDDSPFADMRIVADGEVLRPDMVGMTARFIVPVSASEVWLESDMSVPFHVADIPDSRSLGLRITGLTIDDGLTQRKDISVHHPLLRVGFHRPEGDACWTAGRARLPAELWDGCKGQFFLRLEMGSHSLPRWVAPAAAASVQTESGQQHLSLVMAA